MNKIIKIDFGTDLAKLFEQEFNASSVTPMFMERVKNKLNIEMDWDIFAHFTFKDDGSCILVGNFSDSTGFPAGSVKKFDSVLDLPDEYWPNGGQDDEFKKLIASMMEDTNEDVVLIEAAANQPNKEIKTIEMFGKPCRIQKIPGTKYWDFLDLPIKSKVYESFDESEELNKNCDGNRNKLTNEVLPILRIELEKTFKIGGCFIPTKEQYKKFFPNDADRVKFDDLKPHWYWTSSPYDSYRYLIDPFNHWYCVTDYGGDNNNIDAIVSKLGVSCAFEILEGEKDEDDWELIEELQDNKEDSSSDIDDFIEDLYDLRKESIAKDGEYGIGNLIFKEFRNLGYLDNLKEIKNKLRSKELSLEALHDSDESHSE